MKTIDNTQILKELNLELILLGFTRKSEGENIWNHKDKKIDVHLNENTVKIRHFNNKYGKNLSSNYSNIEAAIEYIRFIIT